MRRFFAWGLVVLSGCVCNSTMDSTWFHARTKLTKHFEMVPAWGTSTTYRLTVEGYGETSPSCTGDEGEVIAAPDGHRIAYRCGSGWVVVYLENASLFEACGGVSKRPDWNRTPSFKEAALEMGACHGSYNFSKLVDAIAAQSDTNELVSFFVDAFERDVKPPPGWPEALLARPAGTRAAVAERLRRDFTNLERWTPARVAQFLAMGGTLPPVLQSVSP